MTIGMVVGFVAVGSLLAASLFLALLDRKEKGRGNLERSRLLSRLAVGLFLAAFLGGVVVTLASGIRQREEGGSITGPMMGGGMPGAGMGGPAGTIGTVDEEELRKLEGKVASDPNDVPSRERLGHLYLQMQDFEKVFQMAHEALQLDPKSAESRVHMGMVLAAMGRSEEGLAQINEALAIDPSSAEANRFKEMVERMTGGR